MKFILELLDRVRAQRTVVAGAVQLIQSLRIAIGEAIDGNDMAKLQEIRTELDANTQSLADALIEGTPVAEGDGAGLQFDESTPARPVEMEVDMLAGKSTV